MIHLLEFGTCDDLIAVAEAYFRGNILGCNRIVSGYHHDPYAGSVALLYSFGIHLDAQDQLNR